MSVLLGFLVLLGLSGCARKNDRRLIVGMELSSPPFEMTDEHNQPTGIGVEMARDLATHLGKELVIENTKFEGLIPALRSGKIDLIVSSMTATVVRAETIDFSQPYMHIAICCLVGKEAAVHTAKDLKQPGRRVVVKNGTTGADYARDHLPQAQIIQVGEEAACVLEVVQGKADVFIYDQLSVYQLHKRNPATTRAVYEPLQAENWAVGIRKGNDKLRVGVNDFLTQYRAAHGLEALAQKYLQDRSALDEMGNPFAF